MKGIKKYIEEKQNKKELGQKTSLRQRFCEALTNRRGSHTVEIVIGVLIAVVVGGIVLTAFKTNLPELVSDVFDKIRTAFEMGTH